MSMPMSMAHKKITFRQQLRRLFHREKPTGRRHEPSSRTVRMMDELDKKLPLWVERKGYRDPARTLEETARQLGTEKGILQRYFHERMQVDFRTWRTRLRIEEAKCLLLSELDTPASVIAGKVGFSDRSNFCRQFTALTGTTPGAWRKQATRLTTDSLQG